MEVGSVWKPSTLVHDPDNHYGVITHLEPDILECEVKWAIGSITTSKLVDNFSEPEIPGL